MSVLDSMRLDGTAAFVTGASRGLGRAAAIAMAEAGADLALAATNEEKLEETAEEIRALGRRTVVCPLDLKSPAAVKEAVDRAVAELGRLDIVVNAAGVCHRVPTIEMPDEMMMETFEVNVYGTLYVCRAAAAHMQKSEVQKSGGGRIVNFGSVAGTRGRTDLSIYGASKAAVMNLTKSLALDWAALGIRVNCIAPGQFDTDMGWPLREDPELKKKFLARVPLGYMANPNEVGALTVYLSSRASAFMTGSVILLDGGISLL